ncbi:hypothetical protein [Microbacterium sp. R86528]|uniref:hypothetical protein n=1 Tax=Microbacterium sp. R86528 TaxID=3093864 RepID=UPI0037C62891
MRETWPPKPCLAHGIMFRARAGFDGALLVTEVAVVVLLVGVVVTTISAVSLGRRHPES